jgi:hypothetical protein
MEELTARVLNDRIVIATLMAAGVKDLELPDMNVERQTLNEMLEAEFIPIGVADFKRYHLEKALGLRR